MYQDAKYLIQYSKESLERARNTFKMQDEMIRIGVSPITPIQLFMELWSQVQAYCPKLKLKLVPFENTPENAREILKNLGQNIQIRDFDFYSTEIFNQCENSKDVLLAVKNWDGVHPLIKILPVDWQFKISFGLLYAKEPSQKVRTLLNALQRVRTDVV